MSTLELFMLGFIGIVAVIGVGWFIYDSRSDEEKQILVSYEINNIFLGFNFSLFLFFFSCAKKEKRTQKKKAQATQVVCKFKTYD